MIINRLSSLLESRRFHIVVLWSSGIILIVYLLQWRLRSAYTALYSYYRWNEFVAIPEWTRWLPAFNLPLRIAIVMCGALLIWLEHRFGMLSRAVRDVMTRNWNVLIALLLIGFVSGSYFLLPGRIALSTDAEAYTGFAALVRDALLLGQWPIWTNYGGMGAPFLQFYTPLYSGLVALTGLVQSDLFEATKFLQYVFHLLSVVGMYCWVCRLSESRPAALVSAWIYGFAFYRYHAVVYLGILHTGLIFALLPWLFYFLEHLLCKSSGRLAWSGMTLFIGLLLLSHPHYGLFSAAFAMFYGLLRLWTIPGWAVGDKARMTGLMLVGMLGGGLIGSQPIIGALAEGQYVSFGINLLPSEFDLGALHLSQVFTFRGSYLSVDWWGGYIGISPTLLAMLARIVAVGRRYWPGIAVGLLFVATLYLALGPGHFPFDAIFQAIPFGKLVYLFDTPGRYLLFVTFFGAAAVGISAGYLAEIANATICKLGIGKQLRVEQAALIVMVVFSAEMVPLLMRANSLRPPNYWDVRGLTAGYDWMRTHIADTTGRVLQPEPSLSEPWVYLYTGRPSFNTTEFEIPAFSHRLLSDLRNVVKNDLDGGEIQASTQKWLYVTNTTAIVTELPSNGDTLTGTVFANSKYGVLLAEAHSPILASPTLERVTPLESLDELFNRMTLDVSRNSATLIPVLGEPIQAPAVPAEPVEVRVLSHLLEPQRIVLSYDLSSPAYIQLSYSYYPYLAVELDHVQVPTSQSAFGLIVFFSEAGVHTVELRPYLSPLRQGLNILAIAYLAVVAVIVFRSKNPSSQHILTSS